MKNVWETENTGSRMEEASIDFGPVSMISDRLWQRGGNKGAPESHRQSFPSSTSLSSVGHGKDVGRV